LKKDEPEKRRWWQMLAMEAVKTLLALGRFVLWLVRFIIGDPS
jgi:hypothetical protein